MALVVTPYKLQRPKSFPSAIKQKTLKSTRATTHIQRLLDVSGYVNAVSKHLHNNHEKPSTTLTNGSYPAIQWLCNILYPLKQIRM